MTIERKVNQPRERSMDEYERRCLYCQIGIKALQNVNASVVGFARLAQLGAAQVQDHILLPSIFYWAVIRYAKPFLNTTTESGQKRYPVKHLRQVEGFSIEMHKHLLNVRNTLIAHDDFDQIAPRILQMGIAFDGSETNVIPMSTTISNKCLSYPADINAVVEMQSHSQAVLNGISSKLWNDVGLLRQACLANPTDAIKKSKYLKEYGGVELPVGENHLTPPDTRNDEWLNVEVPDYSCVHRGFVYEEARIKRDFFGPETITLPNGNSIVIKPGPSEGQEKSG